MVHTFASSQVMVLEVIHQCHGIRGWSLWEVIRFWRGGAPDGFSARLRSEETRVLPFHCVRTHSK